MLINVPQYIDVEDKIVGSLTAKQLMYLVILSVLLIILWNVVPIIMFIIAAILLVILFVALAFYKPFGQPLPNFMFQGILYMFKPKLYVWRREAKAKDHIRVQTKQDNAPSMRDKRVSIETLHDLANVLDTGGEQHNKKIDEWIASHGQIKK